MLPARFLWLRTRTIIGANDATIGGDDPDQPKLKAIIAPYTDNPNLVAGDLTFATTEFDAYPFAADGNIDEGTDPVSQAATWQRLMETMNYTIKASGTGLPVTVYGTALVSNDEATLYATEMLPNPVTFDFQTQETDIPRMRFFYPRDLVR